MIEKLCIFCTNFRWKAEEQWGCGSTMTGPMMTGGDAQCSAGKFTGYVRPRDEDDWRAIIIRAANCDAYQPVKV